MTFVTVDEVTSVFVGSVERVEVCSDNERSSGESSMAEGSRRKHEIMLHVERLAEDGEIDRASELFKKVDKEYTRLIMREISAEEYIALLEDIEARDVVEKIEVVTKKENKRGEVGVFIRKENMEGFIVDNFEGVEGKVSKSQDREKKVEVSKNKEAGEVIEKEDRASKSENTKANASAGERSNKREIGVFTREENTDKIIVDKFEDAEGKVSKSQDREKKVEVKEKSAVDSNVEGNHETSTDDAERKVYDKNKAVLGSPFAKIFGHILYM